MHGMPIEVVSKCSTQAEPFILKLPKYLVYSDVFTLKRILSPTERLEFHVDDTTSSGVRNLIHEEFPNATVVVVSNG